MKVFKEKENTILIFSQKSFENMLKAYLLFRLEKTKKTRE
jgi:hypothetical protein